MARNAGNQTRYNQKLVGYTVPADLSLLNAKHMWYHRTAAQSTLKKTAPSVAVMLLWASNLCRFPLTPLDGLALRIRHRLCSWSASSKSFECAVIQCPNLKWWGCDGMYMNSWDGYGVNLIFVILLVSLSRDLFVYLRCDPSVKNAAFVAHGDIQSNKIYVSYQPAKWHAFPHSAVGWCVHMCVCVCVHAWVREGVSVWVCESGLACVRACSCLWYLPVCSLEWPFVVLVTWLYVGHWYCGSPYSIKCPSCVCVPMTLML